MDTAAPGATAVDKGVNAAASSEEDGKPLTVHFAVHADDD